MIIFLYGEDTYRLNQARDDIIAQYQAKHSSGFNLFKIDGRAAGMVQEVKDALRSASLFSEVKLVLIKDLFSEAEAAAEIKEILKEKLTDPKVVVLVIHPGTEAQAKPKELFNLLSAKTNLVRNFEPLQGAKLQVWLKKEALDRGTKFASGALAKFSVVAGSDSWARIQNLDKLANYCAEDPITPADIDLLIKTENEANVFEFIDALGSGQKSRAFSLLAKELTSGRDPYYLLTMVVYQFRNLLMVKDLTERNLSAQEVAQKSGLHPFVVKKAISATSRMKIEDLKCRYQEILELEQATKQGRRDLEDGLFNLALA